ncbi:chemotaxis-specific protein-glutamate methyltransferase CheB [Albidovulum sp.]|uniref:chemotaxis-specific protein-glutamate methyltransferase CheB n=1 Tax=Albidovulum sp. TaxID=1872424 RepID=UPI003D7F11D4
MIIDDSATVRALLRGALASDGRCEIVGEAADPIEARDLIKRLQPDVLTLDIEMPKMDGLTFLDRLMRLRPMPVVMLAGETMRGSTRAIEALTRGAVDCLGKSEIFGTARPLHLGDRLIAAARSRPSVRRSPAPAPVGTGPYRWNGRVVLIGASTGGVEALETVLRQIPADGPPVLVVQHMSAPFIERFVQRLADRIAPAVRLATDGCRLEPGTILFAPGGGRALSLAPGRKTLCRMEPIADPAALSPSVDRLFASARPMAGHVVAVLLTGMGSDGVAAMGRLRAGGARCLAQDAATSVVFGMPGAALASGAAEMAVPLPDMAERILELTGRFDAAPGVHAQRYSKSGT